MFQFPWLFKLCQRQMFDDLTMNAYPDSVPFGNCYQLYKPFINAGWLWIDHPTSKTPFR